ncbi:MAG: ribonuclease III [Rickettsiales bacterium]|nr:ribonuclease III [Rickettsiales bacterium]
MNTETLINYQFKDRRLLDTALTHPSVSDRASNQRLEFLGDAVLGLLVTRILYDMYPSEQEGELARRRSALVCGEMLARVARDIGLGEQLHIGSSEKIIGGRDNDSNLEDALEALIGALYLDGGLSAAEQFINAHWPALAQQTLTPPKDAKTALQEWAQGRGLPIPIYNLINTTGPAHSPEFTIEAVVEGCPPVQARAGSKRSAEQLAAKQLLEQLL